MMPKVGPSLTAAAPPAVKFGVKFLDKAIKLQKKWLRIQEYVPLLTGAIGFGLIWQGKYVPHGEALWYSSEGMFLDEAFTSFFELIDPKQGGGGHSTQTFQLADGKRLMLKSGMTAAEITQQLGIPAGARTGSIAEI